MPAAVARANTDAEIVQQLSGQAQEILASVNQHRVNAGLQPLVADPLLNQAAQHHVNDMLANYNYSHRGSDGSSVKMRVARTGYAADPWVSENWVSSRSVEGAMRWWMNDYIHRVNILTPRWREIGVGVASRPSTGETIFVTVFSAGRGDPSVQPSVVPAAQPAAPAPAPAPLPAVQVPAGGMDYTIRGGDTLLGIAIRHSLDWRVVAAANGLGEQSILQIGQTIRLPGVEQSAAAQFDDDATTGSTAGTEEDAPPPIETQPYTVEAGDTLFSIAARYGITWQQLATINNFREQDFLQIGQSLQVPLRKTNGNGTAGEATVTTQSNGFAQTNGSTVNGSNYTENFVVRDYTPLVLVAPEQNSVALTASAPVADAPVADAPVASAPVASAPDEQPAEAGFVQTGGVATTEETVHAASVQAASTQTEIQTETVQDEMVHAASAQAEADIAVVAMAQPIEAPNVHIVQPGETIISIAVRHGVDWQQLLSINGLNEQSLLQLGQEIRLP